MKYTSKSFLFFLIFIIFNNSFSKQNTIKNIRTSDKSDRIFVLIDGRTYQAKNGKFSIKRFSPVDEKINIVAIDKWGNKSKTKTVNVIVDIKETEIAEKLEPLNPSMIKAKANNNRVALIVGIEKY